MWQINQADVVSLCLCVTDTSLEIPLIIPLKHEAHERMEFVSESFVFIIRARVYHV